MIDFTLPDTIKQDLQYFNTLGFTGDFLELRPTKENNQYFDIYLNNHYLFFANLNETNAIIKTLIKVKENKLL